MRNVSTLTQLSLMFLFAQMAHAAGAPADLRGSVAALVDQSRLKANGVIRAEETGASCAGVLVGADLVLTAGACAETQFQCDRLKILFGRAAEQAATRGGKISKADIYRCRSVEAFRRPNEYTDAGRRLDFALVRLDRPVEAIKPAAYENGPASLRRNDELLVANASLPGAASGRVEELLPQTFTAELSAAAPAGAGVFQARTGRLAGIISRDARRPEGRAVVVKLDEILVRLPLGTL